MDLLFICPSDDSDDDWPSSPVPSEEIPEFIDFSGLYIHPELTRKESITVVRFSEKVEFIPHCDRWSEEDYSAARESQWQCIYLDRLRFEKRILEINSLIGHIFVKHHKQYQASLFQIKEDYIPS